MSHRSHRWLRLAILALVLAIATWGSLWIYVYCEAHRAMSMIADAARVQVGDSEASIRPLVKRYGGFLRTAEPLPPREEAQDKREYDYRKNLWCERQYALQVSPFGLLTLDSDTGRPRRITWAMWDAVRAVSVRWRAPIAMRVWGADIDVAIRGGRVQWISAMVLVEGRTEWIGHISTFTRAMPRRVLQGLPFVSSSGSLSMGNGGGTVIETSFTQEASAEQIRVARAFSAGCLTSIRGCDGFCDLVPCAIEYLKRHSEVPPGIDLPVCH